LRQEKTPVGLIFRCPQCSGQAVSMAVLRKSGSKEAVLQLWNLAKEAARAAAGKCPVCDVRMTEVALPVEGGSPVLLEVCKTCQFVWLDASEYGKFPSAEPPEDDKPLSAAAIEAIAMRKAQIVGDQAEREQRAENMRHGHASHAAASLLFGALFK
jgi:Zn-finger nucleic acid-binding protein